MLETISELDYISPRAKLIPQEITYRAEQNTIIFLISVKFMVNLLNLETFSYRAYVCWKTFFNWPIIYATSFDLSWLSTRSNMSTKLYTQLNFIHVYSRILSWKICERVINLFKPKNALWHKIYLIFIFCNFSVKYVSDRNSDQKWRHETLLRKTSITFIFLFKFY